MWSAWLSIHSPQYSSRRSDRTEGSIVTPNSDSNALTAVSWYAIGQMPQIRATMSITSSGVRPTTIRSK